MKTTLYLFTLLFYFCNPLLAADLSLETSLTNLINEERRKEDLAPLTFNEDLFRVANEHSVNMAKGKVAFGHAGFDKRANVIMKKGQHTSFGENVAYFYNVKDPIPAAVQGWMDSPSHRDNILGHFDETAIAIAYSKDGRCYITQVFAKKQ